MSKNIVRHAKTKYKHTNTDFMPGVWRWACTPSFFHVYTTPFQVSGNSYPSVFWWLNIPEVTIVLSPWKTGELRCYGNSRPFAYIIRTHVAYSKQGENTEIEFRKNLLWVGLATFTTKVILQSKFRWNITTPLIQRDMTVPISITVEKNPCITSSVPTEPQIKVLVSVIQDPTPPYAAKHTLWQISQIL